MSRRRAPLIAIKAKERLDLLARVISAAPSPVFMPLVTNPILLRDSAGFTLSKEHYPRGQQPAGHQRTQENKDRFPNDHDNGAIGNGTAYDCVEDENQREIKRADEAKPGQTTKIVSDQLTVRPKSFP